MADDVKSRARSDLDRACARFSVLKVVDCESRDSANSRHSTGSRKDSKRTPVASRGNTAIVTVRRENAAPRFLLVRHELRFAESQPAWF